MTTTTPSAALVVTTPVFTNTERLALAGFLAGYSGLTRQRSKKNSSITRPPPTYGARGWITSRTPSGWTVTSSARRWSPPGSARPPSMR